ncbi:hypothetical protein N7475_000962 [Penicillium sp. IBT 31633x]|nr:hypothetical protein N7475_000962 [Penicillium sp. IBT 31633x]
MIGIAARSGIALGLNLQKNIKGLDVSSSEARKSLWWSIFRLENLLSVMTGRVSCLGNDSCSTSPPLLASILDYAVSDTTQLIKELQWTIHLGQSQMISQRTCLKSSPPSQSLFFFYMVDLSLITQNIINKLYPTRRSLASWVKVEKRMAFYYRKVEFWKSTLHPAFCFQDNQSHPLREPRSPFQISLAFNYYSVQILLYRPSLNSSLSENRSGSQNSRALFDNKTAKSCLRASLAVISLLPDQPDLAWCYEVLQWWDLLHVLIQAIVIILLEISVGRVPITSEAVAIPVESADLIWVDAKKGLSWLRCLGRTSEAARRAFHFFHSCILRIDPTVDVGLDPSIIEVPKTCNPDLPWPRGSPNGTAASLQQGNQVIEDSRTSNATDSRREVDIDVDMRSQDLQEDDISSAKLPSASAVLDADVDMPELFWSSNTNIEDILLSMVEFNS